MNKAYVFSIEEFSVFDGPGIRTTVFLMGCPLRCEWCHNPEGQGFSNFIMRSPNGCLDCGTCQALAEHTEKGVRYTEAGIRQCPQQLLRYCAQEYTPDALLERLQPLLPLLRETGGITFSGGEPTASAPFLLACLTGLRGKAHRAIQTCGACAPSLFSQILSECDYVLFDLKLADAALHKRYTGQDNAVIWQNFEQLASSTVPFVIRMPLIPTVTDTAENITAIAMHLQCKGIHRIELLPYQPLTGSKYPLSGRRYAPSFPTDIPVKPHGEIWEAFGIQATVL